MLAKAISRTCYPGRCEPSCRADTNPLGSRFDIATKNNHNKEQPQVIIHRFLIPVLSRGKSDKTTQRNANQSTMKAITIIRIVALLLVTAPTTCHGFVGTPRGERMRTHHRVESLLSSSSSLSEPTHHPEPPQSTPPERRVVVPADVEDVLSPLECALRTGTLLTFLASMCVVLPTVLAPLWMLQHRGDWMERPARETLALTVAQRATRVLWRMFPFCQLHVTSDCVASCASAEPRIWVCNHTSMLDTFVLLAVDAQLRGPGKRPIKTVYVRLLPKKCPRRNITHQILTNFTTAVERIRS